MPDVFGLKTITYWQAVRLLLIAAILFGGPFTARNAGSSDQLFNGVYLDSIPIQPAQESWNKGDLWVFPAVEG